MSTVDPLEEKRRRERARIGSAGALVGVIIGLLMIAAGGVLEARALFGFIEFDQIADLREPPAAVFGMIVGLPLLIGGFAVHVGASRRFTGKLLSAPGVGSVTVLFAGFAVGAWWGILSLPDPGVSWVIPAVLTALALALLLAGVAVRARRRARAGLLAEVLRTGTITTGTVSDIPELDASSGGLVGQMTVAFTDATGIDRWVQKMGQWPRRELPVTGDAVAVLYDPARASDTSRIWVGPVGSKTAADFARW